MSLRIAPSATPSSRARPAGTGTPAGPHPVPVSPWNETGIIQPQAKPAEFVDPDIALMAQEDVAVAPTTTDMFGGAVLEHEVAALKQGAELARRVDEATEGVVQAVLGDEGVVQAVEGGLVGQIEKVAGDIAAAVFGDTPALRGIVQEVSTNLPKFLLDGLSPLFTIVNSLSSFLFGVVKVHSGPWASVISDRYKNLARSSERLSDTEMRMVVRRVVRQAIKMVVKQVVQSVSTRSGPSSKLVATTVSETVLQLVLVSVKVMR